MNNTKKNKIKETFINTDWFIKIYSYFYIFITIVALIIYYICSKKNGEFNQRTLVFAVCWPHIYIMYIAGTGGLKSCFSSAEEEDEDEDEDED